MQYPFLVHVENGEGNLCGPLYYGFFLYFFACVAFFLFEDELVEVAPCVKLHYYVEFLSFSDGLLVCDNVDMLELFQEMHFIENILDLLRVFACQLYLFYDVVFLLAKVVCQIGVAECS